jgi:regulator of sigma E protease
VYNLGYLIASKFCGYEISEFFIGWGKKITSFTIGKTDYSLCLIPIGGGIRSYNASEVTWKWALFAFAGPAAVIVFAVAILTALYAVGRPNFDSRDSEAIVGYVLPGSAAARARLQAGDQILQIGDVSNPKWGDVLDKEMSSPAEEIRLRIHRHDAIVDTSITFDKNQCSNNAGFAGWSRDEPVYVMAVSPGSPAQRAGLLKGDLIVIADKELLRSSLEFEHTVWRGGGSPLNLVVMRNGVKETLQVAPVKEQRYGSNLAIGIITGSSPKPGITRLSFKQALRASIRQNLKSSHLIIDLLTAMFSRRSLTQVSIRRRGQPDRVAMIELAANMSLQIGIFNLLPIPGLVGGTIFITTVQLLVGRTFPPMLKERIYQAVFVALIVFAIAVIYKDVSNSLHGAESTRSAVPDLYVPCGVREL